MSIKRNGCHLMAAAAILLFAGQAAAANVACPAAGDIKLAGSSADETSYKAVVGETTWKGEVSKYDDDVDLKTLHFVGASIANAKNFVACDYYGEGRSNLRMTIDTKKASSPANPSAWTGKDGEPLSCKNSDVAKCEFH
ncbi:MAG TPA: hypothetical protein VM621_08360 [Luteibacter sp.]|uniref:hypothetical protein n=1 Tax=Luteibacter sp. TaxID=1886636 RepID=UPI002C5452FC|nr:hypothetical protein [Luteibacter sp.]HVI55050.1 hypothetical protein [Luteibacter sp.]